MELRGAEGPARLNLLFERLAENLKARLEQEAGREGAPSPAPWFDAWERLTGLPAEAEALNLDRQDVFWTAIAALRQAARAPEGA
jgi:DNA polymerase-3 subunit delta'